MLLHTIQGIRGNIISEVFHLVTIIIESVAAHTTDALDLVLLQDAHAHRFIHHGAPIMSSIAELGLLDVCHLQGLTNIICTIIDPPILNHLITVTLDLITGLYVPVGQLAHTPYIQRFSNSPRYDVRYLHVLRYLDHKCQT